METVILVIVFLILVLGQAFVFYRYNIIRPELKEGSENDKED